MSRAATRNSAAIAFERISRDPRIDVVPHSAEFSKDAVSLFAARSDKDWSLTDCLSFVVMERKGLRDALTADNHFEQAGFRAILTSTAPKL